MAPYLRVFFFRDFQRHSAMLTHSYSRCSFISKGNFDVSAILQRASVTFDIPIVNVYTADVVDKS